MQIPLKTIIVGLQVLNHIFGEKPGAAAPAAPPPERPTTGGNPFGQTMQIAKKLDQLGDRIDFIQKKNVEQLVRDGDISKAMTILENLTGS